MFDDDDGFGNADFENLEWTNLIDDNFPENNSTKQPEKTTKIITHKTGLHTYLSLLMRILSEMGVSESKRTCFMSFLILRTFGKRNLEKKAVDESEISQSELYVYKHIRQKLQDPIRRKRIFDFIQTKDITKRLINFFVVHYVLIHKEVTYYLDKRQYPYKIIGELNQFFQSDIIQLQESGANIVWINLHQEYKNSKTKNGKSNLHAPYARSISVKGDDQEEYSLCALHFYCWFDDVGGFEAFSHFETDIREKKKLYDEKNRKDHKSVNKKRKVPTTNGRNYKTFISQGFMAEPYDGIQERFLEEKKIMK
jgi:hypothetical protein